MKFLIGREKNQEAHNEELQKSISKAFQNSKLEVTRTDLNRSEHKIIAAPALVRNHPLKKNAYSTYRKLSQYLAEKNEPDRLPGLLTILFLLLSTFGMEKSELLQTALFRLF